MALESLFKIVFGVLLIALGIYGLVDWWVSFITILKGVLPVLIIFVGILFFILGFEN